MISAVESIPESLLSQLNKGGRMLVPVNNDFVVVDRDGQGEVRMKSVLGVRYVPLTSKQNQLTGEED